MVKEIEVDPSTGHYPSPYSLSPLGPVLKGGLMAPGLLGLLSVITTLGLLGFIVYRFSTWRRHYRTYVGYNQYVVLCMNLLIADFIQAVSFLFSFHWIRKNGIFAPTSACFAQGFLLNIGDLTSGFFVMAIAFHTFYTAVKGRRIGHIQFIVAVVSVWTFGLLLSIIGPIEYRDRYFVRAGAWCWAGEQYQTDRLALHYLWIFIVQFGTIIIYVFVLLRLRAAVAAVVPSVRVQSSSYAKVDRAAKLMVLYPLAYIVLTLPLSAGRMWSMAHHEKNLPDAYQCVAGALLASCGWVDALLYTLTRKALINGGDSNRRTRSNNNGKSSKEDATTSLDDMHGSILQTRTITVSANQVFALDTIIDDEDQHQRGRKSQLKHHASYKKSGRQHSPTGSLDPIISGHHLGVGCDKLSCIDPLKDRAARIDAKSHSFANDSRATRVCSLTMRVLWLAAAALLSSATAYKTNQYQSDFSNSLASSTPFSIYGDRPDDCPPCFNCNLDGFQCHQYANCTKSSGKCSCPSGFGGEDCSQPLCGSLAEGHNRLPRQGHDCECNHGWEGINCNVCKTNDACNAMMPEGNGGVCYREGLVVNENYQICDITNRKILDQLKEKKPQATFSCNADRKECNFQFWVDQVESFYCALDTCTWSSKAEPNRNSTSYHCENIKCRCIPGRMLCGEADSIDIGDFLLEEIKGPASFSSVSTEGGSASDGSKFQEPAMNDLISSVFGDDSITLKCHSGECLYVTDVPGYERPVKKINTPLIAGVIAGCALFVVAVILIVWFLSRRKTKYGPIHLSDDEDDLNATLLADHKPASLYFENVSYSLKGKQILTDIQGAVHPGQLMAIMGASGAGKTTFLDILARKNKRGTVIGNFLINGEKIPDNEFRSVIGFVDQDDTMLPTLTVHETIVDSAMLRLPKEMSYASKLQKVEDVERQLGIYHIRDQLIGSEEGNGRGISGGEKRRVGIACELVTSPSILFLDEPTSGLDAFNAFNVVECLVNLVKTYNRTVVFTIHQPRSNIVALFDQLVLLAKGRTVYSGPFGNCQAYFDNIGYSCPPGFNIADYLVDLTMHASTVHPQIPEDSSIFRQPIGRSTRASSAVAVKSVPSVSNFSVEQGGSITSDSPLRPKNSRTASIKQQQDRALFTRKQSSREPPATASTIRSDASSLENSFENTQQWLKMRGVQQSHDDPNGLPPDAEAVTNTDLDNLVQAFADSDVAASIRDDIHNAMSEAAQSNGQANGAANGGPAQSTVKGYRKTGILGQFVILSKRTWRNLYRNPLLMLTHYAIAILLAVFLGFLFYGLTDDLKGFQNRLGFFFFLLALFAFSTLTSLTVFAPERLLFVRERAKGYYSPLAYYASKVVFDIVPLRLIPPVIMAVIVYPMTGLLPTAAEFWKFMLFVVLFNLAAATVCLCIGIVIKNQGVANLVGVLVMLFSLLFGGFLLNHETIPKGLRWLQSISIFHYGFEGLIVNEVRYLSLIDHKYGLDIEVPGSAILSSFGFNVLALWNDAIGLAVFCGVFLVLGYVAMHFLLVERR
ncbi:hypothetical protein KCU83_g7569, partial [Aureobasidium melanogenum]